MIFLPEDDGAIDVQISTTELESASGFLVEAEIWHRTMTAGGEDKMIGKLKDCIFAPLFLNKYDYEDMLEVGDEISGDARESCSLLGQLILSKEITAGFCTDWLHLGTIEIDEEYRGRQYGYHVLKRIVGLFGNRAVITALPAHEKLTSYWKSFGLTEEWDSESETEQPYLFFEMDRMPTGFLSEDNQY